MSVEQHLRGLSTIKMLDDRHINFLTQLKEKYNFYPQVVYDIGGCVLEWTKYAKQTWPDAKFVVWEAMESVEFMYKEADISYHIGVLSDQDGKLVKFYQNDHFPTGNSYYRENPDISGTARHAYTEESAVERLCATVDTVRLEKNFPLPQLVKIDVQGCEIDILHGMQQTLQSCQHLIVELQHSDYNIGAKKAHESIPIIENMGFKLENPQFSSSGYDADYHFVRV